MNDKNLAIFPFVIIFYAVITYLSNDLYLPALLDLIQDFHSTPAMAQLTLTAWFLGSASTQLVMGPLSDHFGRRPILLIGAVIFIIATAICAATPSMSILLLARFIQGSAVCSLIVAGYATIHELYDTQKAIHVLALMGSVGILAPAFGPLLGSFILVIAGWRYLFWILVIGAMIALLLLLKWMPESNPKENRIQFSLKHVFSSYGRIVKNKNFMLATIVLCLIYSGLIAWLTMGPLLVTEAYHYTPITFGILQAFIFGAFIAGNMFIKSAMQYMVINKIIFIGLLMTLAGSILAVVACYFFSQYILLLIVALMIFAAGAALQYGTLQRIAIEKSQEAMGLRMAIFSSCLGIAGVVTSAVCSYFYNDTTIVLAYFLLISASIAMALNYFRDK